AHDLVMKPGTSHGSVKVGGKKRTFRIHIPKDCPAGQKVPLVIVMHGGVGCGWSAEWDSQMSAQSEKDHFIVVYPNGRFRSWNASGCCGPARKFHVDDVAFMHALIERFKKELPVDGDRVFVTGISNGGMLAYRLAGELPDEIAAIAPIEGCMYPFDTISTIPVSVIVVHGTADRIIRYDGGTGSMFGYKVTSERSVPDTIQFWVDHDKCNTKPIHEQTGRVSKDLYAGGTDGTEVCLYTIHGGGHCWPGGRRCVMAGYKPYKDFSATEAIAAFFLSHPKRGTSATE
ncbi:MAG: alpha/beta hydrolase family esterase, partial [Terriglobales bacterium]